MVKNEIYKLSEFASCSKPDVARMDSNLLMEYYNKYIHDHYFINKLNNGKTILSQIEPRNFFHVTGLSHVDDFVDDMLKQGTKDPNSSVHNIKGYKAYSILKDHNFELNNYEFDHFFISRLTRFNRLHKVFLKPDSIIELSKEHMQFIRKNITGGTNAFKEGDLLYNSTDGGKTHTVILGKYNDNKWQSGHWVPKSFYVDRPEFSIAMKILEAFPDSNLCEQRGSIVKGSPQDYVRAIYSSKYPFMAKLGSGACKNIIAINSAYDKVLSPEKIHEEYTSLASLKKAGLKGKVDPDVLSVAKKIMIAKAEYEEELQMNEEVYEDVQKSVERTHMADLDVDI